MTTVLLVLGIWLLSNILFVVLMAPPRKPREVRSTISFDPSLAPAKIKKDASPSHEEEEISIRHIIVAVGMGAFFALSPPIAAAIDSIKRAFGKKPSAE